MGKPPGRCCCTAENRAHTSSSSGRSTWQETTAYRSPLTVRRLYRDPSGALVFGTGAVVVGLVALLIVAADRATDPASSPITPPAGWKTVLVVAGLAAFVAYVLLLALLRQGGELVPILVLAIALQLLPLLGPTLLSRDAYTYWAYGRVSAAHGSNPYVDPPARWPDDSATVETGSSWREQPSLYGPVFTLASRGVAALAGDSARRASFLFRGLAALSIVAILAFVALLASNKAFAVALVGLNPLVALHFGGGGHNDALMIALVLGALVLHRRSHDSLGGLAWALSALVKWVSVSFLALVVIGERRAAGRRILGWSVCWLAVLGIAASVLYGTAWLGAANRVSQQARRTGSIGLSGWLSDLGLSHRPIVVVIGLLTLAAACWLVLEAWRGRVRLGLAGVLLAALQGWLNPWYALWGLALAAPEEDRTAQSLAVALSGFLLLDALPL